MAEVNLENQFLELVNENIGIVHKISRVYFHEPEDQQDLFQEIIFQLWKSFPSFSHQSKFSTWMYQVALNTAITYFRREKKNFRKEELQDHHLNVSLSSEQDSANDRAEELNEAIKTLSRVDKSIVLLHLNNYNYEEIALMTGMTKSNVSVRLVRIKRALEVKLKNKI
jgi:RNA polymerase sigma factor (sigma-70 family)